MKEFKKAITISSSEADGRQNYKAYSFMCDAQEIANDHATSLGFGYNQFISTNVAWVLSRMKVRFIRAPKWQENVVLSTWHKGIQGIFSMRNFEVHAASDDSLLIAATSAWLIIDLSTRKMLRTDHTIQEQSYTDSICMVDTLVTACDKLIPPKDMAKCGSYQVCYSDIDFNHHVNNAKYVEWAMDQLDPLILSSHDLEGYQINFLREATLGDQIDFYISSPDPNSFFIEGRRGDENIFQTMIKFKP